MDKRENKNRDDCNFLEEWTIRSDNEFIENSKDDKFRGL